MRTTLLALFLAAPALAGDLLVSSWTSHSIKRYDADTGAPLGDLVSAGDGGLVNPHSVAVGPGGDLFVSSFGTGEVLRYDAQGSFVGVFVAAGAGGLSGPTDACFGPTGALHVASRGGSPGIKRYDGQTGVFLDQWIDLPAGLNGTETGEFGPDGHFYLALGPTDQVLRFDGESGALVDTFVQPGDGNLDDPHEMAWGPDGDLYVTSFGNARVKRYDGLTGAFIENFVKGGVGLANPHALDFRPDGLLYVASFAGGGANANVRRYDGLTGDFVDDFVGPGAGGLTGAISLTFRPDDTLNLSSADGSTYRAYGAEPGETVWFLVGDGQHRRPFGACADPVWLDRLVVMGSGVADALGVASLTWSVPPPMAGLSLRVQAAAPGSCRPSAVQRVTLP